MEQDAVQSPWEAYVTLLGIALDLQSEGISQVQSAIKSALDAPFDLTDAEQAFLRDSVGALQEYLDETDKIRTSVVPWDDGPAVIAAVGKFSEIRDAAARKTEAVQEVLKERRDKAVARAQRAVDQAKENAGNAAEKVRDGAHAAGDAAQAAKDYALSDEGRKNIGKAGAIAGAVAVGVGMGGPLGAVAAIGPILGILAAP